MTDNKVTLDEIKDLIAAGKLKPSDLFSEWELKNCVQDQEAVDRAREEVYKKGLAAAEKGKIEDKPGDVELNKYLDPKKNPMIKIGE